MTVDEARDLILASLLAEPNTSRGVSRACGLSKGTGGRAVEDLERDGLIRRDANGLFVLTDAAGAPQTRPSGPAGAPQEGCPSLAPAPPQPGAPQRSHKDLDPPQPRPNGGSGGQRQVSQDVVVVPSKRSLSRPSAPAGAPQEGSLGSIEDRVLEVERLVADLSGKLAGLAGKLDQVLIGRKILHSSASGLDPALIARARAAAEEKVRCEREGGKDVTNVAAYTAWHHERLLDKATAGDQNEIELLLDNAAYRNVAADLRRAARAAKEALDKSPAERTAFEAERRLRGHGGPLSPEESARLKAELADARSELARLFALAREAERRADPACFKRPSAAALPENAVEVKR